MYFLDNFLPKKLRGTFAKRPLGRFIVMMLCAQMRPNVPLQAVRSIALLAHRPTRTQCCTFRLAALHNSALQRPSLFCFDLFILFCYFFECRKVRTLLQKFASTALLRITHFVLTASVAHAFYV